jgi:hypothetical protein
MEQTTITRKLHQQTSSIYPMLHQELGRVSPQPKYHLIGPSISMEKNNYNPCKNPSHP